MKTSVAYMQVLTTTCFDHQFPIYEQDIVFCLDTNLCLQTWSHDWFERHGPITILLWILPKIPSFGSQNNFHPRFISWPVVMVLGLSVLKYDLDPFWSRHPPLPRCISWPSLIVLCLAMLVLKVWLGHKIAVKDWSKYGQMGIKALNIIQSFKKKTGI